MPLARDVVYRTPIWAVVRVLNLMKPSIFFLSFCILTPLHAAEETPLSLGQALARAAERNPTLAAQAYRERAAAGLIEQAGTRPNPTLEVLAENFAGTGRVQGVRSSETTVQASQTFERGGKREKRITLANRERDVAAKAFAVQRAEVLAATATAFVDTLASQQRIALAEESLQLAREIAAAVAGRVKAGATSSAEAARARVALATAQGELARAEAGFNATRNKLAATWGGNPADVSSVVGSLPVPDSLPSENHFAAKIAAHPRLAFQQAIIASRRASLELEQAHATQDITVGGGVRFLREGSDAGFVAGLSVPLSIHNKNRGNIRAARETLAGAEHTVRAVETELRTAFTSAWQELAAAHAAAQALRRQALPATEEAHAAVHRAYQEGQLPLIDVLDAQRALIGLRRELLETEASYATAHAQAEGLADSMFPVTAALLSSQ